jgi:hypothetical protein
VAKAGKSDLIMRIAYHNAPAIMVSEKATGVIRGRA